MEAIILAGGFGTRLASRLNGIPKPMAPVAGRPFIEILIGRLARAGCKRVILSVGHLHHVIQDHFGPSFQGVQLEYVIEEKPLGTGGAIRLALPLAHEESALVLNGDTILQMDYAALLHFHARQAVPVTLAVTHQADTARYGGVLIDNHRIVAFHEKGRSGPGWINAGVFAVRKDLLWPPSLPQNFSFERDYLMPQSAAGLVAAFEVNGYFLDIGIPEDLDRAQIDLKDS